MAADVGYEPVYRTVRADLSVFTEDFSIVVTIPGSGSIAGQTFAVELFDPDGAAVAGPTVSITDAALRKVTAVFNTLTLVVGLHKVVILRTDVGSRTVTNRHNIFVENARKYILPCAIDDTL